MMSVFIPYNAKYIRDYLFVFDNDHKLITIAESPFGHSLKKNLTALTFIETDIEHNRAM
jgi:hypothetical protein